MRLPCYMMMKKPVILDCDPGADDFLAILLLLASPEIEVLGITTVFGNAAVEQTAWNAARACLAAGKAGPLVYAGAAAPLMSRTAADFTYCGKDGLCDSPLPGDRSLLGGKSAGTFLEETLETAREPVTVISTAAMTNLAALLRRRPDLAPKISEIVTVSGYYGRDPAVARAEWNILLDPEAARIVFSAPAVIRAVGLDVTAGLQNAYVDRLLSAPGGVGAFLRQTTDFNLRNGLYPYSVLVDGMAAAAVILPGIAHYQRGTALVRPERTDSGLMEFFPGGGSGASVHAADRFDYEAYLQLLEERVIAK